MAKRFNDTNRFDDSWYSELPMSLKVAWEYINAKCDLAGVWVPNKKLAEFQIGTRIEWDLLLKLAGTKIAVLKNGSWWLTEFVFFQYKNLNPDKPSNLHAAVIALLHSHGIDLNEKGLPYLKNENSRVHDGITMPHGNGNGNSNGKGEEVKVISISTEITFDTFWNLYEKKVDRPASEKLWEKLSKTDKEKIIEHIPKYKLSQPDKQYRKNPDTYLRNKSWNDEIISNEQSTNTRTTALTANIGRPSYGGAKSL